MGEYSKGITAAKAIVPTAVLIGGSNLVQVAANAVGIPITDEKSYMVITTIYAGVRALLNWIKNRRK